jgi:hypothetical protein
MNFNDAPQSLQEKRPIDPPHIRARRIKEIQQRLLREKEEVRKLTIEPAHEVEKPHAIHIYLIKEYAFIACLFGFILYVALAK